MNHADIVISGQRLLVLSSDAEPLNLIEWSSRLSFTEALDQLCGKHAVPKNSVKFVCAVENDGPGIGEAQRYCTDNDIPFLMLDARGSDFISLIACAAFEGYKASRDQGTLAFDASALTDAEPPACVRKNGVLHPYVAKLDLAGDSSGQSESDNVALGLMLVEDLNTVLGIEFTCFPDPWSPMAYLSELQTNPNAIYLCVMKDRSICGYLGFWITTDGASITKIAVDPVYQRQGLATRLIDKALQICRMLKQPSLDLEVRASNDAARSFYRSCGFAELQILSDYYSQPADDAVILRHTL